MSTNPRYSQYGGASSPSRGTGVYTGKITLIYDDGRVRVFINTFGRNIGPCRIINKSAGDAISLNDEVLCTYANDTSDELIVVGRLTERVDPVSESTSGLIVEASTTSELVRITQKGTGAALLVEDSTNPDSTPFIIDASGNVGIGISSPTAKIDVSGAAVISGDLTVDTSTLKVDSSNNRVGIGTASPSVTLDISGATSISGDLTVDTTTLKVDSSNNRVGIGPASPSVTLDISGAASISGNLTVDTTTFAVDATNNRVGIGTVSPSTALQVVGTVTATAFTGPLTGNVTGNVSGTAATVTGAAQTAITSVGTLTGLTVTNAINGTLTKTVTGTNTADLIYGNMAGNDQFRIRIGGTATNAGYVEIATADDGTEPIHVRQYTGVFATLTRTATLLDGSGNTSFPGTVTASAFSGNASTATNLSTDRTNWSTNGTISAVVGQLGWKNYGNSHTIFDASQSTSPNGGAVNNTNSAVPWTSTYPTLMGWNGANTYGVRVDSARIADTASTATSATTAGSSNATTFTSSFFQGTYSTLSNSHYDQALRGGNGGSAAGMALWVSGIACQFRLGTGEEKVYLQNSINTSPASFRAIIDNASSKHLKQDIKTFPMLVNAAGSAVNEAEIESGLNIVRQLRPVTYKWKEKLHLSQLPSNPRRALALSRLNKIRSSKGLEPYESDELQHDCSRDNCNGTAENPCSRVKNWENGNIGFIAQEVGALVPQAANLDKDGEYSGLDNLALTAIAVSAIKEMDAKVTSVMERIEALENK